MSDLFVSYASEDRKRVSALVDVFTAHGWSVWWDRELVAGPSFESEIESAINAAKCVIVVWSKHSIASHWCRAEAAEGLARGVLVPLTIDDVRPPLSFRGAHTANLTQFPTREGELQSVLEGIRRYLIAEDQGIAPTQKPQHQRAWRTRSMLAAGLILAGLALWGFLQRSVETQPGAKIVRASTTGMQSVAVLEIRNLSNHPDGEWLAGGLTEELRRELAGLGKFNVLPGALTRGRSAGELAEDAQILVDGYLQVNADEAEVVLEIVMPASTEPSIKQSASAPWQDSRTLQRLLAANLANVFGATVSTEEWRKPSADAWSEYLRYVHEGNHGDIDDQIYWLERTLEIDPEWYLGWAFLAVYRLQQYNNQGDAEYLRLADVAAGRGAADTFGSWVWPYVRIYGHGEIEPWASTIADMAGLPGVAIFYPQLAMAFGLNEEVREPLRRLAEREPYNTAYQQALAYNEMRLGNHERAQAAAERMVELTPADSYQAWMIAGIQATQAGDYLRANQYLVKMQERTAAAAPGTETRRLRGGWEAGLIISIAAATADRAMLQPIVNAMTAGGQFLGAATVLLMVGDDQAAAALLDESAGQPVDSRLSFYIFSATMTPAQRAHPVTAEIARRMGFTPELRLAMCQEMAQRPKDLGYSCDPSRYEVE